MQAIATIRTASAKRYLGQFAKHFNHKVPVELAEDNRSGKVVFTGGACRLWADGEKLQLELEANNDAISVLKDIVTRHLVRFAFREELNVDWSHVVA